MRDSLRTRFSDPASGQLKPAAVPLLTAYFGDLGEDVEVAPKPSDRLRPKKAAKPKTAFDAMSDSALDAAMDAVRKKREGMKKVAPGAR
jgi:hypothetical protein